MIRVYTESLSATMLTEVMRSLTVYGYGFDLIRAKGITPIAVDYPQEAEAAEAALDAAESWEAWA